MCLNNWLAYGESFVLNRFGDLRIIFYVFLCKINIGGETRSPLWFLFLFIRSPSLFYFSFISVSHLVYNSSLYFLRRFVIGISFLVILYRKFIQSLVNIAARNPVGSDVVFFLFKIIFLTSILSNIFVPLCINFTAINFAAI